MDARLKCSNCGAEITNLTFGWPKKQFLWSILAFLPFVIVMLWMHLWLFPAKGDLANEFEATMLESRINPDRIDVVGKVKNVGTKTWNRVTVEAEFYDENGHFIDEASEYFSVALSPEAEEHFRITLLSPDDQLKQGKPKIALKVTDADRDRL